MKSRRAPSRRSTPRQTGYTVHTGSNEKFVAGWDHIFSGERKKSNGKKATAAVSLKKTVAKRAVAKKVESKKKAGAKKSGKKTGRK